MRSSHHYSPSSASRFGCRFTLCASVLSLLGCASMAGVGGSAQFACKAPMGVQCDSVSGTYFNAVQQNLPSQQKSAPETSATPTVMDQLVDKRAPMTHPATGAAPSSQAKSPVAAMREVSTPLRSPARVLRLWIKPWEDSDGDLHSQSYVYVPIDAGRWLLEHYRASARAAYAPIKAPRSVARAPAARGSQVTPEGSRTAPDEMPLLGAREAAITQPRVPAAGDDDGR